MKTIVWKELREHGFWGPLALIITSLITLFVMYRQDLLLNQHQLMTVDRVCRRDYRKSARRSAKLGRLSIGEPRVVVASKYYGQSGIHGQAFGWLANA